MLEGEMICARKELVWVVGSGLRHLSSSVCLELAWKLKGPLSPHAVKFTAEGSDFTSSTRLFREEQEAAGRWIL